MLKFKKFSSIENSINREFIESVRMQMPLDQQYVVQEKVHGANTSFLCDGLGVGFAKRTAPLADDETFYDFQAILADYKPRVLALYKDIKDRMPQMECISVFGELFGGRYPHVDVEHVKKVTLIQKGVYYCPGHEFYGFDIYVHLPEGGKYLSVDEANTLFEKHGFFYARTLMQGTLEDCLQHPNGFQSHISEWLGLPAIDDNICEGIVIRPVEPMYLHNGSRVLIKSKNARFAEKKNVKARNKLFSEPLPYSEALKSLIDEAEAYVTENRLANVVSHIGELHLPKDFGRLIGMLSKDAYEDFLKEHGSAYFALDKCEQKLLTRQINGFASALVKKVYLGQAYIL